jgi:hypothetical protein
VTEELEIDEVAIAWPSIDALRDAFVRETLCAYELTDLSLVWIEDVRLTECRSSNHVMEKTDY